MPNCKDVGGFLEQVRARGVTAPLPPPDVARLAALGLVQVVTADAYRQLQTDAGGLPADEQAVQSEQQLRSATAAALQQDVRRDQSILFHLHGAERRAEDQAQEAKDRAALQAADAELLAREQAFNRLLAERASLDALTPMGDGYVGLTATGAVALRDLTVRLYRFGDTDFESYLAGAQQVDQQLGLLAAGAAAYAPGLIQGVPGGDAAYLWAIGVGLSKAQPDPRIGGPNFLGAYQATGRLSGNLENRLMASEILASDSRPLADELAPLEGLVKETRKLGVPSDSALGVAAIILYGRRADGSFALPVVQEFLQITRSYESAALLGILNVPTDPLAYKFRSFRALFESWGYEPSEDTELASAYLAVADLGPDQVGAKLAILARGLRSYLEYPLVAAAVLGSIPTLEANETLNVVEKAYGLIGARAGGLGQSELVCIAVRMVDGIRNQLVGQLDTTATVAARPATGPSGFYGPRFGILPIIIVHNAYYSTFGGISGVHAGHVHGLSGGFGGVGVG